MKTFYINKYRNIVTAKTLFLFLFIFLNNLINYCQPASTLNDSIYYKNPDRFIARYVLDGKIVMLADVAHHYYDVYNSFLKVLYALAEVSTGQSAPTKLSIILEMSSKDAEALENYVTGGTLDKFIESSTPYLFYEDMEYYSNLRKFYDYSIKKSNIIIDIAGFEPMNSKLSPEIIKTTYQQIDSIFLVRDSILSLSVIKYINDNPDRKILIFYGGGHLLKGLSSKTTNYGTCGDCLGYYMADYLKRYYGDHNVVTFDQKWLDPEYFRGTNLAEAEFSDIVAPATLIDSSKLHYTDKYDYFVLWNKTFDNSLPHRFDLIFSRRSAQKYSESLRTYDSTGQNDHTKGYYNSLIYFFNLITCNDFKDPVDVAEWNGLSGYLGLNVMKSECFKKKIYEIYAHSKSKKLLFLFGFNPGDIEIGETTDTLKRFDEIWNSNLEQMIFLNQIGVMWIGYPDEQKLAKDYLIQYSGKDFDDPSDYIAWYRINKNR
jgi:hypothetical protein